MGRKSERREQRIAAARARDRELIERASRDPMLLDWMQQSRQRDPRGFRRAAVQAMRVATRPSAPDYHEALVALGGLQALGTADQAAQPKQGLHAALLSTADRHLSKLILGSALQTVPPGTPDSTL